MINLQTDDSGLASYVAGQVDRSLSWKVRCVLCVYVSYRWQDAKMCGLVTVQDGSRLKQFFFSTGQIGSDHVGLTRILSFLHFFFLL